jgi:hypothetical protein
MGNKILYAVLGGVFLFAWFWTGYQEHYATDSGNISNGWWIWTVLTVAVGAGQGGEASNPVNAIIDALKGFIPTIIAFLITGLTTRVIYEAFFNKAGFQVTGIVDTISTVAAASILTLLVLTCVRRSQ